MVSNAAEVVSYPNSMSINDALIQRFPDKTLSVRAGWVDELRKQGVASVGDLRQVHTNLLGKASQSTLLAGGLTDIHEKVPTVGHSRTFPGQGNLYADSETIGEALSKRFPGKGLEKEWASKLEAKGVKSVADLRQLNLSVSDKTGVECGGVLLASGLRDISTGIKASARPKGKIVDDATRHVSHIPRNLKQLARLPDYFSTKEAFAKVTPDDKKANVSAWVDVLKEHKIDQLKDLRKQPIEKIDEIAAKLPESKDPAAFAEIAKNIRTGEAAPEANSSDAGFISFRSKLRKVDVPVVLKAPEPKAGVGASIASVAKKQTNATPAVGGGAKNFYPLPQLTDSAKLPADVNAATREEHIEPTLFKKLFDGCDLAGFQKLPKWRRDKLKKAAGIF